MKKVIICIAALAIISQSGCIPATTGSGGAPIVIPPPPAGNLKYSITVSKFKNEANWSGWNIGTGFATVMTDALQESGYFIVLGDQEMRGAALTEQDFAASGRTAGGKKAPKIGRMTPAQLLVRGSVTHVQNNASGKSGGLSYKGISIGGSGGKATVNITIYIIDSSTGQVKASTKVVGVSNKRGFRLGYHGSALGGLRGGVGGFKEDNVGKACEHAVGQAVLYLIKQLEGIQWEGTVISASRGKITINRGIREGVKKGDTFQAGSTKEIIDPDTGELLDTEMTEIATLLVTAVKEKIAYCKVIDGKAKEVKKGITIMRNQ